MEIIDIVLAVKRPNYYWEGEARELGKPTLVWVVTLEADYPGRWAEVWVDAKGGEVLGGSLYR